MEIVEQTDMTSTMRELWNDWFPNKHTHPNNIARVVANKDWLRASLIFYGWSDGKELKPLNINFIDAGAVLYYGGTPCAILCIDFTSGVAALKFTYVDNRS